MLNPPAASSPVFAMRLPPRTSPVWEYLFLFAFTCLLLWPLCVGRALYWGDILLYFAPMLRFQQTALQQGHIPLWNPTILGGQPLVGNPQMGVFYPTTPLLRMIPVWMYISVTTLLHVFLCGAFMNVYLRGWSGDRWARIAGSLTYMGSECLIGRIQFPPMIFSAPYFPLLLFCIDRCLDAENSASLSFLDNRRLTAYARLSLVIGLLALAAHPQMAYLILVAGSLYAATRIIALNPQPFLPKKLGRRGVAYSDVYHLLPKVCRLIGAGLLGLMLASVQILPAIQVLLESPREKLTPAQANRFFLEPAHLLRLLFPRFWGHPASADFWGGGNGWEPAFFIGWLPLVLISIACVRLRRRRKAQFWIAAALMGIWLAFGNVGGLYWVAFKIAPGLSNFHDPARFLVFTTIAFAVLTTMGWEASWKIVEPKIINWLAQHPHQSGFMPFLNTGKWENTLRCCGMVGVALPLWYIGRNWNPTVPHEFYLLRSHAPALIPLQGLSSILERNNKNQTARLYLPAHEQFWKHYVTDGYSDYGPDDAIHFQAILDTLMPNLNTELGLESASGYEPVPLSAPAAVDALGRVALRRGEPNLSRLLALMGANALMLPQADKISAPRFDFVAYPQTSSHTLHEVFRGTRHSKQDSNMPVRVWHNKDILSRAWLVRSVRRVEGRTRLSAALAAPDFHPDQEAILQDALVTDASKEDVATYFGAIMPNSEKKLFPETNILFLDAHNLELEADCGIQPGFLVVGATAFPGWQAEVDFRPVPLHRVDDALMGLPLLPSKHFVTLRYKPACYQAGLYLSLLAAALLCAAMGYSQTFRLQRGKSRASQ